MNVDLIGLRDIVGSEPGLKLWEISQAAAQFRWLRSTGTVFDRGRGLVFWQGTLLEVREPLNTDLDGVKKQNVPMGTLPHCFALEGWSRFINSFMNDRDIV